jgi:hypothetical protein
MKSVLSLSLCLIIAFSYACRSNTQDKETASKASGSTAGSKAASSATPAPTLGPRLKASSSLELRGWASEGKILLVVTVPAKDERTLDLGKIYLSKEGNKISSCVGLVLPKKVAAAITGHYGEWKNNEPIPVESLKPAKPVKPAVGSTDISLMDFFLDITIVDGLVAGNDLSVSAEGKNSLFVASSGITYLLLSDGYHWTIEKKGGVKRSGVRLPAGGDWQLLFVIPNRETPNLDLVRADGTTQQVEITKS